MLKPCAKNEFDQYVDFAYELATDAEKSAYPTYCDGIKTKEMFIERLLKAYERETEEIYSGLIWITTNLTNIYSKLYYMHPWLTQKAKAVKL